MIARRYRIASRAIASPKERFEAELIKLQTEVADIANCEAMTAANERDAFKAKRADIKARIILLLEALHFADRSVKPKARIGDKRYQLLTALRHAGPKGLTLEELAEATTYERRRIREQLATDIAARIVIQEADIYRLTGKGIDLLARHEAYQHTLGNQLPQSGAPVEDDTDGAAKTFAQQRRGTE
ncbi:hypothetical protein [Roseicella aerolata]|uniref:Uncharacterized protein n=1 Tax=Roseicella aerolata TaxID=2883479 RepID=A0A9X1IBH4_9PROT|nr:hypothetical protein [Roseicella aerolata]MCB4821327.1 hypothetical protein [Roseicella aerolata]